MLQQITLTLCYPQRMTDYCWTQVYWWYTVQQTSDFMADSLLATELRESNRCRKFAVNSNGCLLNFRVTSLLLTFDYWSLLIGVTAITKHSQYIRQYMIVTAICDSRPDAKIYFCRTLFLWMRISRDLGWQAVRMWRCNKPSVWSLTQF